MSDPAAHPSPRVSVGLPVYNGADHVAEAIESVLSQTYRDLELVICDNASTDRTQEICRRLAERAARAAASATWCIDWSRGGECPFSSRARSRS